MPQFVPISQAALVERLVEGVRALPGYRVVAIDGADAARPVDLAERVAAGLRDTGRAAEVVRLHDYVRPASLRVEFGRDEVSYRTVWFDYEALRREVVDALHSAGRWLPALWDEVTDRSARAAIRSAADGTVLIVAGPMLLERYLEFDLSVRLEMSEQALRRNTPDEDRWTIPALVAGENGSEPTFFVRWDHPDRPALRVD